MSHPPAGVSVPAAAAAPSSDGLDDSDILNDVFVESTWRGQIIKYDREQQSEPSITKEAAVQAKQKVSSGCQTDSLSVHDLKSDAPLPSNFGPFLSRVASDIFEQLDANLESLAFENYLVAWEEERDAYENVFSLAHVTAIAELGTPTQKSNSSSSSSKKARGVRSSYNDPPPMEEHAAVLAVGWSCNGSVLVASYGSNSHPGWCNHSSATLSFWNIMRRQISSTKPDFVLEQDSCCMCVAYHPERPTWLAGGMFNGEVRVWDTSLIEDMTSGGPTMAEEKTNDATPAAASTSTPNAPSSADRNPCLMRSSIDDHFHREPITRLEWVRDSTTRSWILVSVSGEGRVLFWNIDEPGNRLQYPTDGYTLAPTDKYSGQKLATSLFGGGGGGGGGRNKFTSLGGTGIAFPTVTYDQTPTPSAASTAASSANGTGSQVASSSSGGSYFLASTEGGGILRIPLSTILKRKGHVKSGESRWSRDAYRLMEQSEPSHKFELKKSIERYAKMIGAETIELATIFDSRPSPTALYPSSMIDLTYESHAGPIYGLACNPFEKNIFATASTDGRIKVFHGQSSKPLLTLEPGSDYLFNLIWSPSRPLVFAVSDGNGHIYVYDLMTSMLQPSFMIPVNTDHTPIQALAWNQAEPSLLASADMKGRIQVFNLSKRYSQVQPGEKRLLEQMAATTNNRK